MTGLPYEDCKRRQTEVRTPRDPEFVQPAYALPPFHPYFAEQARQRRRRRSVDGAVVSGVLTALCLATLIVTVVAAATLPV
ncbi:hypothetical protein ACWD4N_03430 [Streptomyces sp. NPDC002586]|uniref:hypothetical protein n=1 Tax=Streptomyces sp. NPDC002589 TaxID=3154420 RepID=UPI0033209025